MAIAAINSSSSTSTGWIAPNPSPAPSGVIVKGFDNLVFSQLTEKLNELTIDENKGRDDGQLAHTENLLRCVCSLLEGVEERSLQAHQAGFLLSLEKVVGDEAPQIRELAMQALCRFSENSYGRGALLQQCNSASNWRSNSEIEQSTAIQHLNNETNKQICEPTTNTLEKSSSTSSDNDDANINSSVVVPPTATVNDSEKTLCTETVVVHHHPQSQLLTALRPRLSDSSVSVRLSFATLLHNLVIFHPAAVKVLVFEGYFSLILSRLPLPSPPSTTITSVSPSPSPNNLFTHLQSLSRLEESREPLRYLKIQFLRISSAMLQRSREALLLAEKYLDRFSFSKIFEDLFEDNQTTEGSRRNASASRKVVQESRGTLGDERTPYIAGSHFSVASLLERTAATPEKEELKGGEEDYFCAVCEFLYNVCTSDFLREEVIQADMVNEISCALLCALLNTSMTLASSHSFYSASSSSSSSIPSETYFAPSYLSSTGSSSSAQSVAAAAVAILPAAPQPAAAQPAEAVGSLTLTPLGWLSSIESSRREARERLYFSKKGHKSWRCDWRMRSDGWTLLASLSIHPTAKFQLASRWLPLITFAVTWEDSTQCLVNILQTLAIVGEVPKAKEEMRDTVVPQIEQLKKLHFDTKVQRAGEIALNVWKET